jgi:hypothetical protein
MASSSRDPRELPQRRSATTLRPERITDTEDHDASLWRGDPADRQIFAAMCYTWGFDKFLNVPNEYNVSDPSGTALDKLPGWQLDKVDSGLMPKRLAGILMFGDLEKLRLLYNIEVDELNKSRGTKLRHIEQSEGLLVDEAVFIEPSGSDSTGNTKLPEVDRFNNTIRKRAGLFSNGVCPVLRARRAPEWRLLDVHEYNTMRVLRNVCFKLNQKTPLNPQKEALARVFFNEAILNMRNNLESNFAPLHNVYNLGANLENLPAIYERADLFPFQQMTVGPLLNYSEMRPPHFVVAWGLHENGHAFPDNYTPHSNRRYRSTTTTLGVMLEFFLQPPKDSSGEVVRVQLEGPGRRLRPAPDDTVKGCCINFALLHPDCLVIDINATLDTEALQIFEHEREVLLHPDTEHVEITQEELERIDVPGSAYRSPFELAKFFATGKICLGPRDPSTAEYAYADWVDTLAMYITWARDVFGMPRTLDADSQRIHDLMHKNEYARWRSPDRTPRLKEYYEFKIWVAKRNSVAAYQLGGDPCDYGVSAGEPDAIIEAIREQQEWAAKDPQAAYNARRIVVGSYRGKKTKITKRVNDVRYIDGFPPANQSGLDKYLGYFATEAIKRARSLLDWSEEPKNYLYAIKWNNNIVTPPSSTMPIFDEFNPEWSVAVEAAKKDKEKRSKQQLTARVANMVQITTRSMAEIKKRQKEQPRPLERNMTSILAFMQRRIAKPDAGEP